MAYLSLGSNLGDRTANLQAAVRDLKEIGAVVARSSIYETEPVDVVEQPLFLNCAVAMETELAPDELLSKILTIEKSMGRERAQFKGPRTIDIDIVLFGDLVIDTVQLTIPHPAMQKRRFVLEPMAEIAADVRHPVLKRSVAELLRRLPPDVGMVRRYEA